MFDSELKIKVTVRGKLASWLLATVLENWVALQNISRKGREPSARLVNSQATMIRSVNTSSLPAVRLAAV